MDLPGVQLRWMSLLDGFDQFFCCGWTLMVQKNPPNHLEIIYRYYNEPIVYWGFFPYQLALVWIIKINSRFSGRQTHIANVSWDVVPEQWKVNVNRDPRAKDIMILVGDGNPKKDIKTKLQHISGTYTPRASTMSLWRRNLRGKCHPQMPRFFQVIAGLKVQQWLQGGPKSPS